MAGAGDLDRRIRLERLVKGQDDMGGSTEDGWTLIARVWAARADLSDAERYAADEQAATRMTRFKVRSSSVTRSLSPADRLFHDGAFYEITGTKETTEGRNRYLEISTVMRADHEGTL